MANAQLTTNKLLFKGTKDGFAASTFHSKCDNKGPTITIVKATTGAIFGGYTSANWASPPTTYVSDSTTFLFSLVSANKEERFVKLTQENGISYKNGDKSYPHSIFVYSMYGPTFGGGHDLNIVDNANTNANSYSNLCAFTYCDTTMAPNSDTAKSYLAGSYKFQVEDYEVYSL